MASYSLSSSQARGQAEGSASPASRHCHDGLEESHAREGAKGPCWEGEHPHRVRKPGGRALLSRRARRAPVEAIEGVPTGEHKDLEALAVVHGQPATKEALDAMPSLRLIVTRSTGYDHIDLAEAGRRNIAVCNVPEYGSTTVAEFTMGLILCLARCIPQAVAESRKGAFSVEGLMGTDLAGKTLGVVGLGKIGRNLARMAKGFEMRIVVHDPYEEGSTPLEPLLAAADVVALCCPLTPETHHLIDTRSLALMKPTAFLVNTARGGVVDSKALLEALDAGRLAGAALDVLEGEEALRDWTPDANMERNLALMNHPNVLVTPHLAYDSQEALERIRETTAEILRAFAEGRTLHAVPYATLQHAPPR